MTVSSVTLLLDEALPDGSLITEGSASISLSARVPLPGGPIYGTGPVTRDFSQFGSPSVVLAANDTFGPQLPDGPGTTYTVTYDSDVPGAPAPWSFWLLAADGADQKLSQLAAVPVGEPGQRYLQLPSGSPRAGQVPVALADGSEATAWGFGAGDANYTQSFTAATTVSVAHNLGKKPAVTVIDSAGDQCEGSVTYADLDNLTLTFSAPFSGTVTCN